MKDPDLVDLINEDVEEMSSLAYEASRYIYFDVFRKLSQIGPTEIFNCEIDFLNYFRNLLAKRRDKMTPDYQQLRHQAGVISSYDGYLRSNIVNKLSQDYAVNFKNNIFIHASKRIQRYLFNRVIKNKNNMKKEMHKENIESSKKTKKKIWKTL
jgi:hypothetical protein